ncbi:SPFH domain-containing protein [Endozoicomonas ascidiicola]|uniref:SPFH domain-containing protein n=1 Tax=Endozoicomonas ascidiicola TaxID=1698521 RepID=UPI00082AA9F9|nr:SPFH domain-containing protein [Endozoicomonas ascidiicola]
MSRRVCLVQIFFVALFVFSHCAQGGFLPYRYTVPEGSVGVFRNQGVFYGEVYQPGTYSAWPRDEGFSISIEPVVRLLQRVPCVTVEGFSLSIPELMVKHQITPESVLPVVTNYGAKYEESLVVEPVIQGVRHLCRQMTIEALFLTEFPLFKQRLKERLEQAQIDKSTGLTIETLELARPEIPEEVMETYLIPRLSTSVCQAPYEIFHTLESERDARERLCGGETADVELLPVPAEVEELIRLDNSETDIDTVYSIPEFSWAVEESASKIIRDNVVEMPVNEAVKKETVHIETVPLPEPVNPKRDMSTQHSDSDNPAAKKQKFWKNRNGQLYLSL